MDSHSVLMANTVRRKRSPMDIGFTGTQSGMTLAQKELTLQKLREVLEDRNPLRTAGHHGLCIGADTSFHYMCRELGIPIVGHPPVNQYKMTKFDPSDFIYLWTPREYLDRNHDIVDCSSFLIATPGEVSEQLRSGTWATIRYARKHNVPRYVILPDGEVID